MSFPGQLRAAPSHPDFPSCAAQGSIQVLLRCQTRAHREAIAGYQQAHKAPPSEDFLDALADFQRSELHAYLKSRAKPHPSARRAKSRGRPDFESLKEKLSRESHDGRLGITPLMARQITQRLIREQGGVSPDMKQLLDALQRDGSKLTPGSVDKLRSAAEQAKEAGLDLGINPATERDLLDSGDSSDSSRPVD